MKIGREGRAIRRRYVTTHRLASLDGNKAVVSLLPTDVTKGAVVPGIFSNVGDLMHCVLMQENLETRESKVTQRKATVLQCYNDRK